MNIMQLVDVKTAVFEKAGLSQGTQKNFTGDDFTTSTLMIDEL
jgi:hypothetical protein